MKVHEFGNPENPTLLLLPGTCCYWKANFEHVLGRLTERMHVGIVSYTGFDEADSEVFRSMEDEAACIERYIAERRGGRIRAAYGCSLGGSLVALLAARGVIATDRVIIGSSDFDQASRPFARMRASLVSAVLYPYIHTGRYSMSFMQKRMERRLAEPDPYNKAFVGLVGTDRFDLGFIAKASIKNQFYSDLVTPIPADISVPGTEIHVLYASKMGEKYLARYRYHFRNPIIHKHNLRHEELLGVHPEAWCQLIEEICGVGTSCA